VLCSRFYVTIGIVLIFKIVSLFSGGFGAGDVYGGDDGNPNGQGELGDEPGGPDKEIERSSGGRKGFDGGRGGRAGRGGFHGSRGGFDGGRGGFDGGLGGLEGRGGKT
jgi:hypothetical protein